jgi:thioredoxin-dependent peroxiredoxin
MARLEAGDPAPDFTLEADDGTTVTLSGLRGERVVLYFYPKDATPGCTSQACEYRDAHGDFSAAGARVFGISPDPTASHARFRAKQELPFTLLSDPDHEAAEAYGVWVEKSMYGKRFMGIERSSFLIRPDGTIEQALYKVKSKGNAAAMLAAIGD